jgi:hypothetical protein
VQTLQRKISNFELFLVIILIADNCFNRGVENEKQLMTCLLLEVERVQDVKSEDFWEFVQYDLAEHLHDVLLQNTNVLFKIIHGHQAEWAI